MNNETKLKCYLDSFTHAATMFFATFLYFLIYLYCLFRNNKLITNKIYKILCFFHFTLSEYSPVYSIAHTPKGRPIPSKFHR